MSIDKTQQGQSWQALVKIEDVTIDGVSSQTLRVAERDTALSDGTLWLKRILYVSPLDQQLGRIFESKFVLPDLTLVLSNEDDWIRSVLDENDGFAGKTLTGYFGYGADATYYTVKFTGQIPVSGAVDWDDEKVTLHVHNTLDIDSQVLPKYKLFSSTYPNVEEKSKNQPIPEVLGYWRTTDGGGETLPCYCVDTTVGMGGQFTPGQFLTLIEDVYLNGASVSYTVNQLSGPCLFTLNVSYDPTSDEITCNGVGRVTTGGHNTCVEWCEDLLSESWGLGLGSSRLNTTAFAEVQKMTASSDLARRWIGREVSSTTLLGELGNEGFFDLYINEDGEYEPVFRYATAPSSTPILREADLKPRWETGGGRAFRVRRDPEHAYANQFPYQYRLKAGRWESWGLDATDSWAVEDLIEDTTEQTAKGQIVRRRLKYYWLYLAAGAEDRTNREKLAFAGVIEMPEIVTGLAGLNLGVTDRVQLLYSKYEILSTLGTPCMVRTFRPDYRDLSAELLLWNLDNLSPKRYQADGSPAWSGATAYDQEVMGFYEANSEQVYF